MFRLMKGKCILVVVLFQLTLLVNAQVYPVQGNVVLNPPYSPYLADLTALGSQRFWLSLRLQDPTLSTYNCKLRLTIEGVGITIRTKNTFLPPPITLEGGGIPQLFYGDDLAAYFNPANLDFAGLTRSQYERTQRLPEGIYRFTIEVLDYNRGTLVSNKIGTTAWIVLNHPPLLNLPQHDRKIPIIEPTNIPFTWTPRHTGSPNAGFTTNYVFKLIELAPNATSQSANAAFLSQPVLFETTLTQNQFVYGPAEPSLLAGRKYAWQVQATDTEGRDLFRNNGKSEVFVFQYGDALGIPRNVLQQGGNATTLSIAWELPSQGEMPTQYRIRYKPYTSPANNWFESVTTGRYYTIGGLNPSTNYMVQVRSERGSIFSEYSAPLQMSTISLEDRGYTCGGAPVLKPPTTTEILPLLFPGDEIKMHDFSVLVTKVEGSNGNYNGTGLMRVSLFNNASVKVRFSGRVNTHYELAGEIVSIPRKNSAMGQLVDEMEKIGADRKRAQDSVANATNPMPVAITITGIIDSVWVQDSVIVVQREDGTQEEIVRPQAQDGTPQQVVLTDSVGNSYTVNEEGEVSGGTTASSSSQNTTTQQSEKNLIKEKVLRLILADFKTEITTWLQSNGKGGEEDELLLRTTALPTCLPEDADFLDYAKETIIPYYENTTHTYELREKIETDQSSITLLDKIANQFNQADSVDWSEISQTDKEAARNLTCQAVYTATETALLYSGDLLFTIEEDPWKDCVSKLLRIQGDRFLEDRTELRILAYKQCGTIGTVFYIQGGIWVLQNTSTQDNQVLSSPDYSYYNPEIQQWQAFKLPPKNCTTCDIKWLMEQVGVTAIRYLSPIEDIIVMIDGQDLDGVQSSQVLASVFVLIEIVPGSKLFKRFGKAGAAGLSATRKLIIAVGNTTVSIGDYINGILHPKKWLSNADEVLHVTEELTYIAENGTQQIGKLEVVRSGSEYGVRVVTNAGNWLDDIYTAQKNIINQWKNNIATATNIRKGNFGEMASDAFLAEKNFQPLHTRLQNIDAPTRQGIDGVFKKGNEYFIVEAKYSGTATLSTLTDGTKQMSDSWIRGNNRLIDAVGELKAQEIIDSGYKRLLAEVAPDGTVIYKELDANANVIGTYIP
jgi:hypothetical protein